MERKEEQSVYNALPTLSKFLWSGGGGYNEHSVELYAVLEVQLRAVPEGEAGGKQSGSQSSQDAVPADTARNALDTVLVPIVCYAEHGPAAAESS